MNQSAPSQKARLRRLNIRLDQKEWDKLHKLTSNSTCRSVSEYSRKVLLEKPVTVFYRNRSFDEFEQQMNTVLPVLETTSTQFTELIQQMKASNSPQMWQSLPLLQDYSRRMATSAQEIRNNIEKLIFLVEILNNHGSQNYVE
jgi:MobC-like protein